MFKIILLSLMTVTLINASSYYQRANMASQQALNDLDCEFEDCDKQVPEQKVIIKEKVIEKPVIVEKVIVQEKIVEKEVPVEKVVVKEVPVEKIVVKEVPTEKEVLKRPKIKTNLIVT